VRLLHGLAKIHASFDDPNLVSLAGLVPVMALAQRAGLGGLVEEYVRIGRRCGVNAQVKVPCLVAGMIGGADSIDDLDVLRHGALPALFGGVRAPSTLGSFLRAFTWGNVLQLGKVNRELLAELARRAPLLTGKDTLVFIDIDSMQKRVYGHAKQGAAFGHTKIGGKSLLVRGLNALAATISTPLAAPVIAATRLRGGNANSARGAASLATEAVATARATGCAGTIVVRADSAGCTEGFLSSCRERNVGFFVSARSNPQVAAAICDAIGLEEVWQPAITQAGEPKEGAAVCELTALIDDHKLPEGTRLIVRREPLHPGAQRSLFPSLEYRYWGFYTDQDGDPVDLDVTMRAHAHVEQHIERLKDSGLLRFPFANFEANANWMMAVCLAADLVRWFQLFCLEGAWVNARPKALRWSLLHAPGRLVYRARRRVVRIIEGWPGTDVLLNAYRRIELIA